MRVIMDNGGVKTHTVNDKAQISHEIEKKTTLDKKCGGALEKRQERTVGDTAKANTTRGSPSAAQQRAEHFSKKHSHSENVGVNPTNAGITKPKTKQSANGIPTAAQQKAEHFSKKHSHNENIDVNPTNEGIAKPETKQAANGSPMAAQQKAEHFSKKHSHNENVGVNPTNEGIAKPETKQSANGVPTAAQQKTEHFSRQTQRRAETISEVHHEASTKSALEKPGGAFQAKTRMVGKLDKKKLLSPEAMERRRKKFKNKRLRLAPKKHYKVLDNGVVNTGTITKKKARMIYNQVPSELKNAKPKKISRQQKQLIGFAMGGAAAGKKPHIPKAVTGARKAVEIGKKPLSIVKGEFYKKTNKSDDNGVKAIKLGLQIKDYGTSGLKTAVNTGVKTVKQGSKITKRVYHKLHKTTSAEIRRKLQKRVNHNLVAEAKYLAKRAAKNGAKAAGKATAKAAQAAAKATAKAAQAAAKAIASAVTKVAAIIAETMPWSLIVIGAIVLIVLIALMFGSLVSGAAGSVAGGGAWLVDDDNTQTPEEIYERYKEFVEQAKDVMETQAKDALQGEVTAFCGGDTADPRRIIEYHDKNNNRLFYPAAGADATINAMIEQFGTEDYADYMSLLFVLMTREKQQADGVTDEEIYDFDFKKEDFEEFMKTVNENSCRWGDTFVIKTAVETSPHACTYNCHRETRSGCHCCSSTDPETGEVTLYCGGHCPVDHTKMTVTLYTVKDYYGKDYSEIYNFTENEKTRYEASKAIIQGLLEYWEDNE